MASEPKSENKSLLKTVAQAGIECVVPFATSYRCIKEGKYGQALLWGAVDAVGVASLLIPGVGEVCEGGIIAAKVARFGKAAKGVATVAKESAAVGKAAEAAKGIKTVAQASEKVKVGAQAAKDSKYLAELGSKGKNVLTKAESLAAQNERVIRGLNKVRQPLKNKREKDNKKKVQKGFLGRLPYREVLGLPAEAAYNKAEAQMKDAAKTYAVGTYKKYSGSSPGMSL